MVGPGLKTGMPIRMDNPHEVGADRLVNARRRVRARRRRLHRGRLRHRGQLRRRLGATASTWAACSRPGSRSRSTRWPSAPRGCSRSTSRRRSTRSAAHLGRAPVRAGLRLRRPGRRDPRPHPRGAGRGGHGGRHRRPRGDDRAALRPDRRGGRPADAHRPAADLGAQPSSSARVRPRALRFPRDALPHRPLDPRRPHARRTGVVLAPLAGIGNWFVRLQAQAPRRRARRVRDGLELRPRVRQRAHRARVPAHPPRRAPGLDAAVRPRRRRHARGGGDGRRRRRRPDRPQHGLPGAQGLQDRRRRRAARRPRQGGRDRQRGAARAAACPSR